MDWSDTKEQAAFRAQVRDVLDKGLPDFYKRIAKGDNVEEGGGGDWVADRKAPEQERRDAAVNWGKTLASHGWFAPQWPKEYGGGGLSPMEQFIYNQELTAAGAPPVGGSGVSLLGPTLIVHGTEEQKKKWLPPILSGEKVYAQGYSEPGAGSDLASLQTRAVRDGDEFVINGQKIWTSGAHHADAMFALVRTDPEAPKHRGITYLLLSMKTPGIQVRPLVQMSDAHGFNEVF